ncbi:MAG: sugar ABC transporter permease [Oscillospiraceae bacterium]|nr:sugar ABC transporter permease [Oscillospiraceae bacterium]
MADHTYQYRNKDRTVRLPYEKRKALYGYGFIALWLIGTIVFFLIPLISSLIYSFQEVNPQKGGAHGDWVGIRNYYEAFTKDPHYREYLLKVLKETAVNTPLILIFSLFIAVILNQKFRGRTFVRAVFFLPVIIASGPVYAVLTGDMDRTGTGGEQFSTMFETDMVTQLMNFTGVYGLNETLTQSIKNTIDNIFGLIWHSGIQILIFLAALQNIPPSAREAAQIEGATSWEYFWKITFPYVSPMIVANLIFTIIDSFIDSDNKVMQRIITIQHEWNYGLAAAMVWTYFVIIMAVIGLVFLIVNKHIYYEVD